MVNVDTPQLVAQPRTGTTVDRGTSALPWTSMLLHWPDNYRRREVDHVQQLRKETRMASTQRLRSTAKSEQIRDEVPVLHFLEFFWSALLWAPTKGPNSHIGRLLSPLNESCGEVSQIYGRTTKRCSPSAYVKSNEKVPFWIEFWSSSTSSLQPRHGANRFSFISFLAAFSCGENFQWYRGGKKLPKWLFCVKTFGFLLQRHA